MVTPVSDQATHLTTARTMFSNDVHVWASLTVELENLTRSLDYVLQPTRGVDRPTVV